MVKIEKFDPVFSMRRDDYAVLKAVNSIYNSMGGVLWITRRVPSKRVALGFVLTTSLQLAGSEDVNDADRH
jgi:hypothetical protein